MTKSIKFRTIFCLEKSELQERLLMDFEPAPEWPTSKTPRKTDRKLKIFNFSLIGSKRASFRLGSSKWSQNEVENAPIMTSKTRSKIESEVQEDVRSLSGILVGPSSDF